MSPTRTIAVAYDASPLSEVALRRGLSMLQEHQMVQLHVVCVAVALDGQVVLPASVALSPWAARDYFHHQVLGEMAGLDDTSRGRVRLHLLFGSPSRQVVDRAYRVHADLLLVGAGDDESSGKVKIGRVAQAILDLSEIPVELTSSWSFARSPASPADPSVCTQIGPSNHYRTAHFGTPWNQVS
jgi:nucleotide-binding universal stress UspA family protein